MKYSSALSCDAAFAPYSAPSDLSWLTSPWLWARAFLIDNQHPLSLPLSLASLQPEYVSELPNTHKSCLKAVFITRSCFLRRCIINQCLWARVPVIPGTAAGGERGACAGKGRGWSQQGEPGQVLLMEWKETEPINRSVVRSVMSLQFSTLHLWKALHLKPAPGWVAALLRKQLC